MLDTECLLSNRSSALTFWIIHNPGLALRRLTSATRSPRNVCSTATVSHQLRCQAIKRDIHDVFCLSGCSVSLDIL